MILLSFIKAAMKTSFRGDKKYIFWMSTLIFFMLIGFYCWTIQLREGLQVTGMSDHVSWGLYISNFTFFVGTAAAAVMLVIPAYVLHDVSFEKTVLMGEGIAVASLLMCLAFVTVDLGSPQNIWHMIPIIGYFNFPESMLAWDVVVLNGYLMLNICIPFYILFCHYQNKKPVTKLYLPFVYLSVFWAVGIHMVTAFLYAGIPARPYWNSSLLGPRFLASAFAAGPALIILALDAIQRTTQYEIKSSSLDKLVMIATVAAQANLIMLVSELFKEFYWPTEHSHSAKYLFFGYKGYDALCLLIWTSILLNVVATISLTIHKLRNNKLIRRISCLVLFLAIWTEKGMGLVVPGFIPSPLGEMVEYFPSKIEIFVTLGILAFGLFVFTLLAKVAINIETGKMRHQ